MTDEIDKKVRQRIAEGKVAVDKVVGKKADEIDEE
jgi:hypothetical protein